jgi:hypothetical protein
MNKGLVIQLWQAKITSPPVPFEDEASWHFLL